MSGGANNAVTQADRDAAADAIATEGQKGRKGAVRRGEYDGSEAVKAFARHRITTTADLQARLDAAEARVAGLLVGVGKHIEMLRHGYAPFVEGALSETMCCSGQMCGCRGASVGEYLAHLLEQDTGLALATARNADAQGGG